MTGLRAILLACLAAPAWAGTPMEALLVARAEAAYGHALPGAARIGIAQAAPRIADAAAVAEFWMDPRTGRFLANVVPAAGRVTRVEGLMQILTPVPVPVRQILPGEVVAPADIRMAELSVSAVNGFAVTDPALLIGKAARRVLTPDRPVMAQSVMDPFAVARGAAVTIAYRQGAMRLSAPGKALGDAHAGEDVRVVNLSSNKTITARARADGTVEVTN